MTLFPCSLTFLQQERLLELLLWTYQAAAWILPKRKSEPHCTTPDGQRTWPNSTQRFDLRRGRVNCIVSCQVRINKLNNSVGLDPAEIPLFHFFAVSTRGKGLLLISVILILTGVLRSKKWWCEIRVRSLFNDSEEPDQGSDFGQPKPAPVPYFLVNQGLRKYYWN